MNAKEIKKAYLEFFKNRGHVIIPRAKLVPQDDATTLFTGSGMQPLLPYLLGQKHPEGVRLVDSQTCLRSQDIEEVGDNSHTTFFEMLGNWSLGDYFKEDQLRWFFEFLVDTVGLDPSKLYVTVFIGDEKNNIPRDDESAQIWKKLFEERGLQAEVAEIGTQEVGDKRGIKEGERIFFYNDSKNWWSRGGGLEKTPIGDPCGPDSEVFYDFGEEFQNSEHGLSHPNSEGGRFLEIGNSVFMQYRKTENGFEPLKSQNVDFGGGLERIAAAKNSNPDVFKTDLLWPIISKIEQISGRKYESHTTSMRVISDHIRAAVFLSLDGVVPSNKEQGYVMRRFLRRAIRFAFDLGVEQNFLAEIVPIVCEIYSEDFPDLQNARENVIQILSKEEKVFRQTLRKGLGELQKMSDRTINGEDLFKLYDTFGFPVEISTEEVYKQDIKLSENWRIEFEKKMNEQREKSKTAAKGVFKGGLGGDSDIHVKYHTATHLMYAALRKVLGDHVTQHGSNITEERLRFDFSHDSKVTPEQLKEIEDIVNQKISEDLPVNFKEMPTEDAFKNGAIGAFGDKYGDMVKVYQVGDDENRYSFEICGGPHVEHTGLLAEGGKKFKITKEESSSAGIRRIKASLQ